MNIQKRRAFWIFIGLADIVLSAWAFNTTRIQIAGLNIIVFHSKWVFLLLTYILYACWGAALIIWGLKKDFQKILVWLELEWLTGWFWGLAGSLVFVLCVVAYFPIRDGLFRGFLPGQAPAVWVIWVFSLVGSAGLKLAFRRSWPEMLAASLISAGVVFQLVAFFPTINSQPLSQSWSEGSSLYFASLIDAKAIYGHAIPLSSLNPTYYFLRGLPFFIHGLPIIFHRVWNVVLWLGISFVTSVLFARRFVRTNLWLCWLAAGWFFLFLLNGGAVHYEVQVCVIIILWGVSLKNPTRSLIAVIISSIWAGMSRLNWFPIPTMLAISLYMLDRPLDSARNLWDYLKIPFLWAGAGLGAALLSQTAYIYWSGNGTNAAQFTTSLTSDLLWYRLFPNATYNLGVLPGILFFTFPLILIICVSAWRHQGILAPLRWLGLGSMLLALFVGGSIVSLKIGGGSDLHNLDSFRILLAMVAAALFFGQAVAEKNIPSAGIIQASSPLPLLSLLVLIIFSTPLIAYRPVDPQPPVDAELQRLQNIVQAASAQKKAILFISQRQLLAFGFIGIPLIPDYDMIELNEMAMAGNTLYLSRFFNDLKLHRFDIIVVDKNTLEHRPRDYVFGEESNLWVNKVYSQLTCTYEPGVVLENSNLLILYPRSIPQNCR